jgi:hypothetical protein
MRKRSLNPEAGGAARAAIHPLERSDHMNRSTNRKRRFAQRCLLVLAAAAIPLVSAQTPSSAGPFGVSSSSVDASKVLGQYDRPTWPLAPRKMSRLWCQPGNDGRLNIETFLQPDPLDLVFDLDVLECHSTWFGPKLGASKLTDGVAQLEISGPESWTSAEQPVDGQVRKFWSRYFAYAPAGSYTVRARVRSLLTGAVVYSDPVTVSNPFQRSSGDCSPSSVGVKEMAFTVGLGEFAVFIERCVETWLDGPRAVRKRVGTDPTEIELTIIDPAKPIDLEYGSQTVYLTDAAKFALAPGQYLFQARYTGGGPIVEPVVTRLLTKLPGGTTFTD